MSIPKRTPAEKAGIIGAGGRIHVKEPLSKKEQQKGPRKTQYKGKLFG